MQRELFVKYSAILDKVLHKLYYKIVFLNNSLISEIKFCNTTMYEKGSMTMSKTMSRAFACPQKYVQGPGELQNLPELLSAYGKKPYIVLDSGVYDMLYPRLCSIFERSNMDFECLSFIGESCRENIDLVKENARVSGCDIMIGMGGGKCIDTAKFASSELNMVRVIVPTSASTDTPAAGISVLYTKDGIHVRSEKLNRPTELVLLDSEIIANAPARLFSAGIGDALATYFEAKANELTQSMNFIGKGYRSCRAGLAIAKECYEILMADGENALMAVKQHIVTEAVENVIEANTLLSGLGFENSGCAAAHGIHSGLSEIASAHSFLHGEKVAFGIVCQLVLENAPKALIDKVLRFMIAVDLPVTLGQLNIEASAENLEIIAEHTINHNPLIHHEPHIVTVESVKNIIVAADSIGRNYLEGKYYLL